MQPVDPQLLPGTLSSGSGPCLLVRSDKHENAQGKFWESEHGASWLLQVSNRDVLWCNGTWISPQQAMFPDKTCMESPLLTSALLANGLPLVTDMPAHVMDGILQYASGITMLSPQLVRSFLCRGHHKLQLKDQPGVHTWADTTQSYVRFQLLIDLSYQKNGSNVYS